MTIEAVFWMCLICVAYAYFGYPIALILLGRLKGLFSREQHTSFSEDDAPLVSVLIPAHNEEDIIAHKLSNTLSLYYPGQIEIVVVSDGSSDNTADIVRTFSDDKRLRFIDLEERKGKANALNVALEQSRGDIIVFSDSSIMLDDKALWLIIQPFIDDRIGCVSGEDKIEGGEGEGLYGRYELYLRKLESNLGSIVGASGSFYAQRKQLVNPFLDGVAPDFLSVLNTVEKGYRAVSTPSAYGYMTAVSSTRDEFQRKVRTLVRGMTALFTKKMLLNPFRFPMFSFFLISHKLMRWWVPFFLLGVFVANLFLLDKTFYQISMVLQSGFYLLAMLGSLNVSVVSRTTPGKVALYFTVVNAAIFVAWMRYFSGFRQEIWTPSRRAS